MTILLAILLILNAHPTPISSEENSKFEIRNSKLNNRGGAQAPDFKTVNLKQEKVELYKTYVSDSTTKATILTFFATWCHSCFEELAFLQELYNMYKDSGFNVIAVSIDGPGAQPKVRSMRAGKKIEFPILLDPKGYVSKLYKIKVLPTAFLLNKKGEIIFTKTGFLPQDKKTYTEKIIKLLYESKTKN